MGILDWISQSAKKLKDVGEIKFSDVNFEYEKDIPVLKNFNLTVAPNETIDQNIQIQWTDVDDFSWTDDQKDPRFAGRVDLIRLTVSLEQTTQ